MKKKQVHIRDDAVTKIYPDNERDKWFRELYAYQQLSWATPKLLEYGEDWIRIEKCMSILDLPKKESKQYEKPLWAMLEKLHESGWWHCDVSLVNVVVHPNRGVLLIDWEHLRVATKPDSYDLVGPLKLVVPVELPNHRPDGVWWGTNTKNCPRKYWS